MFTCTSDPPVSDVKILGFLDYTNKTKNYTRKILIVKHYNKHKKIKLLPTAAYYTLIKFKLANNHGVVVAHDVGSIKLTNMINLTRCYAMHILSL